MRQGSRGRHRWSVPTRTRADQGTLSEDRMGREGQVRAGGHAEENVAGAGDVRQGVQVILKDGHRNQKIHHRHRHHHQANNTVK